MADDRCGPREHLNGVEMIVYADADRMELEVVVEFRMQIFELGRPLRHKSPFDAAAGAPAGSRLPDPTVFWLTECDAAGSVDQQT